MSPRSIGILLVVTVGTSSLLPDRARAQDGPQLILPLLTALALGSQVAEARAEADANPISAKVGARRRQGWLPSRLWIPDLYRIEYERDPLPFAVPIDEDTMVAFYVYKPRDSSIKVRLAYDTETPPIGTKSDVFRLEVEIGF